MRTVVVNLVDKGSVPLFWVSVLDLLRVRVGTGAHSCWVLGARIGGQRPHDEGI
jgi:hypothetical protein